MKTNISAVPPLDATSPASSAPGPMLGVVRFLTRREVAEQFGVSASTITRWARTGLLAAVRTPGGHYRYRPEDVLRAIRSAERREETAS